MEEDVKETIVVNKDALEEAPAEPPTEQPAETGADTMTANSIPDDDIEYTLLIHEVSDLTIPVPGMKPAEDIPEEDTPEEEAAVEAAEEEKEESGYGLPEGHVEMGELKERIAARRRYNERKKRRFRTRFYVLLSVIIIGNFFFMLSLSSIFTVDSIEVKGNKHYTAEEIINMGHAVPGRNLFYGLNKQETEDYLKQNPYIKSATVSRKLPSTMVIKVTERKEKLAFRYDDDYLIMDDEGILLKKTRNAPKTTLVEGIVVSKIKLGEKIGTVDAKIMDMALDLVRATSAADLYFVKIDLSNTKKVKAYIYDTLAVKTDYDTLMTNLENGRLHLVVEKLFSEGIERGTITFEEDGSASFMPVI